MNNGMNEFDELLMNMQGIRGLKNYAINQCAIYATKKFRKHFGIDMSITDAFTVQTVTKWIKKYDKDFKNHLANPYDNSNGNSTSEIINDKFFVKLRKDTCMYLASLSIQDSMMEATQDYSCIYSVRNAMHILMNYPFLLKTIKCQITQYILYPVAMMELEDLIGLQQHSN